MNTWKVILATLVIFGTGVVTGGLLVVYSNNVAHHQEKPVEAEIKPADAEGPKHPVVSGPVGAPGRENRPVITAAQHFLLRREFLKRLDEELKLSAEQRERIEKIMDEGQRRIQELSQQIDPQIRAELNATRERIRAELTPAQQPLYAEVLKRNRPNAPHPTTNALPARGPR